MIKKATKGFIVFLVLLLSGVISTTAALAAELVAVPELGATAEGAIKLKQGESTNVKVDLSYGDGNKNTSGKITIDKNYEIKGTDILSNTPSAPFNFDGISFSGNVTTSINAVNATPGTYRIPVKVTINNSKNGDGNSLTNTVLDYINVTVLSKDSTAPVVEITNPVNGGFYQSSQLPDQPAFSVKDESPVQSSVTGYSKAEGTHSLTVTATDANNNTGRASLTYTVDNTLPVITSTLRDGGVYNSTDLEKLANSYASISDQNLKSSQADPLDLTVGNHTVSITAEDKAGNKSAKTISYVVDNDVPAITFNFKNNGFYNSTTFGAFNPYFNVTDGNLDTAKTVASEAKLTEGPHSIDVSATDLAGNSNKASAGYTIDDTNPEVTIHLENGKFYNLASISAVEEFYSVKDLNLSNTDAKGFGSVDGSYSASVEATDKAGNKTTKAVSYTVDTVKPVITINSEKLAQGGFYKSSYLKNLSDFYTVEDANLDKESVVVEAFNFKEGTHSFSITATDKAGNSTTETISYTVDDSAPAIGFNLTEGAIYKSSNLPANYYTATDNNGVVSIVSADDFNAAEGTHTLTVTVMDAAGNETTGAITYTVDDTAPVVSISAPADGGFYNSADLPAQPKFSVVEAHSFTSNVIGWNTTDEATHTATVTATDAAGNTGSDVVTYTVDNTSPSITSKLIDGGFYNADTLKSLETYFEATDANLATGGVTASELVLTEGEHTAVITATDKAGNKAEKTIRYTVDNTLPTILFNFNQGGFYTTDTFKTFAPYYTVEDKNLDANSIKASEVSFTEGDNKLTVSASDLAFNKNEATASYTIDNTKPEVTLSLEEGKYYTLAALEKLGQYWTATDANLAEVTAAPLETADGTHTATVTAVDKAGNKTVVSVQYHIDNTAPVIELDGAKLTAGGFYNAAYLQGLTAKPYSVVDANPATDSASEFVFDEGTHEYTVTATDKAGNTGTKTISYHVDNTAPSISFNVKENGIYNAAALEAISQYYNATDKGDGQVVVSADPLVTNGNGTITLNVTATDKAGNRSNASVTYTVDNTLPEVGFHLTGGKHYTTASLTEALAGKENYYTATDAHLGKVTADPLATTEGVHTLNVTALDAAGNQTVKAITYFVDNTAPAITGLTGLFDGQRFLKDQVVNVTPIVSDNLNGELNIKNQTLDTSTTGKHTVAVAVTDQAGNSSTFNATYYVYNFSGVLEPVKADGTSAFQKNRTVPVKFQISDGSLFVQDATATIHLVKVSGASAGGEIVVTSTSNASIGNEFRYDAKENQYIFNLATKDLDVAQYKAIIKVTLDGNTIIKESPLFNIKK